MSTVKFPKPLKITPSEFNIDVTAVPEESEPWANVAIKLYDGGETADGVIDAKEAHALSVWFNKLSSALRHQEKVLKAKAKKGAT